LSDSVNEAVEVLKKGGVIAYPTEYCYGLGCDPCNDTAVQRLLRIKHRPVEKGLVLVASNQAQVEEYADLQASPLLTKILASWPGPHTWLLTATDNVSALIRGEHTSVAIRWSDHPSIQRLCALFGGAIVSSSANRLACPELMSAEQVQGELGSELDLILDAPLGGVSQASSIRDGVTGIRLR
jgi:L-threonylcarbamoyladenylate synthase